MVRTVSLFAILLCAAVSAAAEKLPLVEVPSTKGASDTLVVFVSGDGGWAAIDKSISKVLADNGLSVVGLNALQYFWTKRTPETAARDLQVICDRYLAAWKKGRLLFVGYSRGADVLPFMASRIPANLRPSVKLIALLGLESTIDFKYTPSWFFWHFTKEPQFPVKPELEKLRGQNILCVYGEKEKASLCHQLEPGLAKVLREPGGHHFAGKYADVADAIIAEAAASRN